MAPRPTALLPRLLADSVLPCALAALALAGALTVFQMRRVDDVAHLHVDAQLEQLAGVLERADSGNTQALLDRALQVWPHDALQRIDVETDDGRPLYAGAPANASFERYRRTLATIHGKHRAIVAHVDPRPREMAREQILIYGAVSGVGIVMLALLAVFALRRRVMLPLRRLQHTFNELIDGGDTVAMNLHEPQREFAQLHAQAMALAGALAAQRDDQAAMRQSSAIDALDRLRQSQAATRSKTQFMALVGHHFRQPMQALQLLTASLHPGIDAEQQAVLAEVRASIATMTRLLDALLEISRLDAGVVAATAVPFSVADLFLGDRATLMDDARRQGVQLVWRDRWPRIHGDLELTTALLHQLASNAIAHAGPHGRVLIAARRVNHTEVRIEVRDSGPGIAAIHQQRIFEEFVQLHDDERHGGYGLGLAIAARLARILGTQVCVRSEPGRGSTFWFAMKRETAAEADAVMFTASPALHHVG